MVIIFDLLILIIGFIALLHIDIVAGKRALSICSGMVIAFLKSAQVLFGECLETIITFTCILLASSNHFIIDYYIIFLFSSLIQIIYHALRLSRYPSVIN